MPFFLSMAVAWIGITTYLDCPTSSRKSLCNMSASIFKKSDKMVLFHPSELAATYRLNLTQAEFLWTKCENIVWFQCVVEHWTSSNIKMGEKCHSGSKVPSSHLHYSTKLVFHVLLCRMNMSDTTCSTYQIGPRYIIIRAIPSTFL